MNKTLVAFFSREGENYFSGDLIHIPVGNTEMVARVVAAQTGGKLFKIEPAKPYPADYNACTEQAKLEQRNNLRPALKSDLESLDEFDFIFLGFPNWWGSMPMPVWTFLQSHDFTGKQIYPFCTHEGSQMGRSESDLKRLLPGAHIYRGMPLRGNQVDQAEGFVASWLRGLTLCPN